ncbi:MAG TPA: cobalamin-dependent protein [Dehalococcoidia bacterium]|nr:cobalamin-dependent protein [Dehalococcoidia bacterium]
MSDKLVDAIVNMEEKEALDLVNKDLASGIPAMSILDRSRQAMDEIGKRFEKGEYFVSELLMGGEILRQISEVIKPQIGEIAKQNKLGKVVFGTVAGDIHDLGKDIVEFMLDINGFEVIDLGVDVPPAKFVEAIKEHKPQVVGLCCLITVAFESMKQTVEAIKAAGLRDNVKIMIGGGTTDEQVKTYAGADAYGKDAVAAVTLAKKFTGAN